MTQNHNTEPTMRKLSPEQERIMRKRATEAPWSSPLNDEKRPGQYRCAACGQPLFDSKAKYESGSGWPSFWAPEARAIATSTDDRYGMQRVEVHCARCKSHLGHVFEDGPQPSGLRYCINGAALMFEEKAAK